ncbi:late embryogenesis abundant protein At1g64065-like [Fagus crenata]
MAEKTNQQVYPLAPATKQPRSDEESGTLSSEELRRKKRIKLAIYIVAFVVLQTIVITVFALTVMRVKTPKVRLDSTVTFQNFNAGNQAQPSFDITFETQVRVKNTNFGPYKYDSTNATFMYQGVTVGQVIIPKGTGVLTLNSLAKLSGKVELMFVMKKKKAAEMNCTMTIDLKTNAVRSMIC